MASFDWFDNSLRWPLIMGRKTKWYSKHSKQQLILLGPTYLLIIINRYCFCAHMTQWAHKYVLHLSHIHIRFKSNTMKPIHLHIMRNIWWKFDSELPLESHTEWYNYFVIGKNKNNSPALCFFGSAIFQLLSNTVCTIIFWSLMFAGTHSANCVTWNNANVVNVCLRLRLHARL